MAGWWHICHWIPIWKLHNDMGLGIIPSSRVARWQRCLTNIKWCSVSINSLDTNSLKLRLDLFYTNNSRWLKATLNIDKTDECKGMNLTENLTLWIRPKKYFLLFVLQGLTFMLRKLIILPLQQFVIKRFIFHKGSLFIQKCCTHFHGYN